MITFQSKQGDGMPWSNESRHTGRNKFAPNISGTAAIRCGWYARLRTNTDTEPAGNRDFIANRLSPANQELHKLGQRTVQLRLKEDGNKCRTDRTQTKCSQLTGQIAANSTRCASPTHSTNRVQTTLLATASRSGAAREPIQSSPCRTGHVNGDITRGFLHRVIKQKCSSN
jgi:hypothetical protein